MRFKLFAASIILILVCSVVPPSQQVSASSYEVNYTLTLEQEDYPEVTIQVNGYPEQSAEFVFLGMAANNTSQLDRIFQNIEVKDPAGNKLSWQWDNEGISVTNGSVQDFTINYSIDAMNYSQNQSNDPNATKTVLFRYRRIFFVAGDVFPTPTLEPEKITVDSSLPEGTTLYASLPSENGTFEAVRDQWGNLLRDFSLAYFAGGHALFTLSHATDWGDEYEYIWFDRDSLAEAWTPLYGNTPWEQAELYMESTESCARYFRDEIGPLPNHRVLFSNAMPIYSGFPTAGINQDWYHYMQIWPRYSEPETCHHVFHQYSFGAMKGQTKLFFEGDSIGWMFREGLPTFYEQILPSQIFGDPRYAGKLFEFYVLDTRGIPFGIRENTDYHNLYNISTLKVFLLDQYIRAKTGGNDSLDELVHAMWEMVKDDTTPEPISQSEILSAFSSLVGAENVGYLSKVANMSTFDLEELEDLRSPFSAYSDWMIHEYFWDKPILFYIYLDIAAAKGDEWPHFATYPHNVLRYKTKALQPVWDFLSNLNGNTITQNDILYAMNASTGQNHAGFFEFWESLGVNLNPNEITDFVNWDPQNRSLEESLPYIPTVTGTLQTEHLLSGVTQQATIHLDAPAPTNQIFIEYQFSKEGGFLDRDEVEKVIQGSNVSVKSALAFRFGNIYETSVLYKVTTDDLANQNFPITLTYPIDVGVSRFAIDLEAYKNQLGELYYLGPIQPVPFELDNINNEIVLPDTTLDGETFFISRGGEKVQYKPGDKIQLSLASGPVEVQLFDKYGFIRGLTTVTPMNLPPTASFDFDRPDTDSHMTMQFTDASSDPDGKINNWFWNFGDGQISSEKDPLYTYATTGSYSVSLTVIDEYSGSDTQVEQITVGGNPQNLPQNNTNKLKLLLIISGIVLVGGSVFVYFIVQKKKRENHQIGIIVLGVVGILVLVLGVFYEKLFVSTPNDINSTPTGTPILITEVPVTKTNDSTVTLPAFSDLAIIPDGDPSDWPMVSPLATDPEDSGPFDFKSLYAFSDGKNLYLRIDPNGSFSTDVPVHFSFDIIGIGESNSRWEVATEPNDLVNVNLYPIVNNNPQIDLGKKYQGAGLDKVFELVIPLENLGNPKKVILQTNANDGINPFPQFDSFDPVTVSFDSGKETINGTTTPKSVLSDSAIILDGDPSDWPTLSSLATDPEESGPYDFKSLYAFSDEKYLYLRIDPYVSFSTDIPVYFVFEIAGLGAKNSRWTVTIGPNDLEYVYLTPLVKNVSQFGMSRWYKGFGLDKVLELVIPLEYLGNPKRVNIYTFANDGVHYFPLYDSFDPLMVPLDSNKETINETATPNTSPTETKDGMTMIFVPEGEFTMGANVNTDEQPIHTVYLDSFWIDQTPVTNAMYAQCVTEGACTEPYDSSSSTQKDYYGNAAFNNYPVIYVDWFQAKTYCEWAGRTLPTEAQWEKAARGTDERQYPWGNESPSCDLANNPGCTGDTTAVGSYPAGQSPYGALDMAGNVWEWVSDWYSTSYPAGTVSNPQGPTSGEFRCNRGGSWFEITDDFRSALRGGTTPLSNDNFTGFRCALPLD